MPDSLDVFEFLNAQVGQALPTPANFDTLFPSFDYRAFHFHDVPGWTYTPEIRALQDKLKSLMLDGTECPLCNRNVELQVRSPYRRIVEWMRDILEEQQRTGKRFVQGKLSATPGGDYAKMRWFGLVERGKNGLWRVTELGKAWIGGKFGIPRYAYVYNGKCLGFSTTNLISAHDALGISKEDSTVNLTVTTTTTTTVSAAVRP